MNFVIRTNSDVLSSKKTRIVQWLSDRFGEHISMRNPSTFSRLHGDTLYWEKQIANIGYDIPDIHKISSVYAHISERGFAIYDIVQYANATDFTSFRYYSDVVVHIDDELICLECKLAVS
jgi:hypothetical protein